MKKSKIITLLSLMPFAASLPLAIAVSCGKPAEVKQYTVTFVAGTGGKITGTTSVVVKEDTLWKDVEKPSYEEENGYIFDNWYNGREKMTSTTKIKSNITITAKFLLQKTITFVADEGGTITGTATAKVAVGTLWRNVTKPTTTPDSTHLFIDWYDGDTKMLGSTAINSDITVTAKFGLKRTITLTAAEGGTISTTSIDVLNGSLWSDVKSKISATANQGYDFKGWYDNNAGEFMEDTDTITSDMNITAQFLIQAYTITFSKTTGGTISGTSTVAISYGTTWADIKKNAPTVMPNQNYQFIGWYYNGSKITDTTLFTANATITANFELVQLTKSVDAKFYAYDTSTTEFTQHTNLSDYDDNYTVRHFNNLPMGYISIETYLGDWWSSYFSVSTSNFVTKITSKKSVSRQTDDNVCLIDHINQTITFNDYDVFIDQDPDSYGPMTAGCGGGENYYNSVTLNEYHRNGPLVIDLTKYSIQTFCYTISGNTHGFMPYDLLLNIFNKYLGIDMGGYGQFDWDYNGKGFVPVYQGDYNAHVTFKKKAKALAGSSFYSADYMEYAYNLLALTLDLRFGMVERKSRANSGTTIKYLENGAYETLKPYHDRLVSTSDNVSAIAYCNLFRDKFDDGGHTAFVDTNVHSTSTIKSSDIYGDELIYTSTISSKLESARDSASVSTGYREYTSAGKGTIAYITFDEFAAPESTDGWSTAEKTAGRELPGNTDSTNYMDDTLRMTMYANKKIKEDNVKNVVVDLSANGGGTVYTEFFIASWLCGGVQQKIYNPKTKSYSDFTVKADIDGDGDFDQDDYLSDDINIYVITSSSSFSCGNMLPCNIQDNRPEAKFIGTSSGGGACYVDGWIQTGLVSAYQMSSIYHMLRLASSSTDFVTVDDGCTITSGWAINENTDANKFYERASINKKIWDQ